MRSLLLLAYCVLIVIGWTDTADTRLSTDLVKFKVVPGASFALNCSNHGNVNTSDNHVRWFKDGVDVRKKNFRFYNQELTSELKFHHVRVDEEGTYECLQEALNKSQRFELSVNEPMTNLQFTVTSLETHNGSTTKETGESVKFRCHVTGATGLVRFYQWTFCGNTTNDNNNNNNNSSNDNINTNNNNINNNTTRSSMVFLKSGVEANEFQLDDLIMNNSGIYSCIVSNRNGFIKKDFVLNVNEPKNTPAPQQQKNSNRKLIIIISLSCIGGISLLTVFIIYISRFTKSQWWKWNVRRPRTHSYHYKPSCSEPPMTPNGNVFKQITPW